jgi:hypothetical protein
VDAQDRFISLFDGNRGAAFPTARVMAGIAIGDGLGWFIGGSFDVQAPAGWDEMGYFDPADPGVALSSDGVTVRVYPKFFTGFKL